MNLGNLDKKTKDKIYQMLYEYRVLTQAAQLILPGVILRMTGLNVINPYSTQKQQTIFLKS